VKRLPSFLGSTYTEPLSLSRSVQDASFSSPPPPLRHLFESSTLDQEIIIYQSKQLSLSNLNPKSNSKPEETAFKLPPFKALFHHHPATSAIWLKHPASASQIVSNHPIPSHPIFLPIPTSPSPSLRSSKLSALPSSISPARLLPRSQHKGTNNAGALLSSAAGASKLRKTMEDIAKHGASDEGDGLFTRKQNRGGAEIGNDDDDDDDDEEQVEAQ
jgi:hypothetical protein